MCVDRLNPMYSLLPPFPIYDNFNRIVVLSDSEYKAYLKKQALAEITVLESRRNRYVTAIADLDKQIAAIKKDHGIETSNQEDNNETEIT